MTTHVVPHHFKNAKQALESSKLGMWTFLVTEVLLFGGLFVAYIMYRGLYPEMFAEAALQLDSNMGALNTIVLIFSSFTMAMAVNKSKKGEAGKASQYMLITLVCAGVFMVVKFFEYQHKIDAGLLPGGMYTFEGIEHAKAPLFFSLYFMMTGLHGFHVVIGMGLIGWCIRRSNNGDFGPDYYTPVELTGIYWHLVDLIWIYLFPLMYLI